MDPKVSTNLMLLSLNNSFTQVENVNWTSVTISVFISMTGKMWPSVQSLNTLIFLTVLLHRQDHTNSRQQTRKISELCIIYIDVCNWCLFLFLFFSNKYLGLKHSHWTFIMWKLSYIYIFIQLPEYVFP